MGGCPFIRDIGVTHSTYFACEKSRRVQQACKMPELTSPREAEDLWHVSLLLRGGSPLFPWARTANGKTGVKSNVNTKISELGSQNITLEKKENLKSFIHFLLYRKVNTG